jgi:hypothetical protein
LHPVLCTLFLTRIGQVVCASGLLVASYLLSALINASPVVHKPLKSPYVGRTTIVVIPEPQTTVPPATPSERVDAPVRLLGSGSNVQL